MSECSHQCKPETWATLLWPTPDLQMEGFTYTWSTQVKEKRKIHSSKQRLFSQTLCQLFWSFFKFFFFYQIQDLKWSALSLRHQSTKKSSKSSSVYRSISKLLKKCEWKGTMFMANGALSLLDCSSVTHSPSFNNSRTGPWLRFRFVNRQPSSCVFFFVPHEWNHQCLQDGVHRSGGGTGGRDGGVSHPGVWFPLWCTLAPGRQAAAVGSGRSPEKDKKTPRLLRKATKVRIHWFLKQKVWRESGVSVHPSTLTEKWPDFKRVPGRKICQKN